MIVEREITVTTVIMTKRWLITVAMSLEIRLQQGGVTLCGRSDTKFETGGIPT